MRILVVHPGALGDIILSLPALRLLGDYFPGAETTLAANLDFATVVATGYAARFLSLSSLPLHRVFGPEAIPDEDLRFWRSFDRIVSWTGSGDDAFAARLAQVHPASLTARWRPTDDDSRHVSRIFLDSLRPWVMPPADIPLSKIEIRAQTRIEAAAWLEGQGYSGRRPLYILHPGAGNKEKRWPAERFLDLGLRLVATGDLLIAEGPAEPGIGRALSRAIGDKTYLADNLPLPQLAGAISYGRAFVGNDSGIAHLAAGLQIPTVVLFGPTRPEHWAPLGKHVSVLQCVSVPRTSMQDISPDSVLQKINSRT